MKPQCLQILKALRKHRRGMTKLQLLKQCGTWNSGGRVYELRLAGYPIITERIKVRDAVVARYRLA